MAGGDATDCNSGLLEMIFWARDTELLNGFTVDEALGVTFCAGIAKASSANFSVTRWLISRAGVGLVGELASKSNFPPSCSIENWSRLGKRLDMSSTGPGGDLESNAANGSLATPRMGEGLGLAMWLDAPVVGRPLRIGTTSGMTADC